MKLKEKLKGKKLERKKRIINIFKMEKVEEAKTLVRLMSDKEKESFKNWCLEWDFHLFPPYLPYSNPNKKGGYKTQK